MAMTQALQATLQRGWAAHSAGRYEEAAKAYKKVLNKEPDNADAHHLLGLVRANQGGYEDAIRHYRAALKRTPEDAKLWNNLSLAHATLRQYAGAAEAMAQALKLGLAAPDARGMLVSFRREVCDWTHYDEDVRAIAASAQPDQPRVLPGYAIYLDDPILQLQAGARKCREDGVNFGGPVQRRSAQLVAGVERHPRDASRLRIAYVSADFRDHPTTHLLLDVLRAHDRSKFEVFAISIGPGDAYQAQVAGAVEHFVDCFHEPAETTAQRLKRLGIDIAIDLMGHTIGARPAIFCGRPANVQATFLGYPSTTGADFFDYILSDSYVTPFDEAELYSENIIHLPNSYQPNRAQFTINLPTPLRREENLPDDAFVFCAFNSTHKLDPYIFRVWMDILHTVPNSVLWLMAGPAQANIVASATTSGIDPARIIFAERVCQESHLARIRLADLFLDTFPYTAHTTASDMLRQGVPVATVRGRTFASRVAGSLLSLVGMQDLVAPDLAAYQQLAIGLATNGPRLASIRESLAQGVADSPLFRPDIYTRNLERAYELMMDRWASGQPPCHLAVEPIC